MSELPAGTLTFVITDVQGSKRHWETDPKGMRLAMEQRNAIAKSIVERRHGNLVRSRGEGDSLFLLFDRTTNAVSAALALQLAFADHAWPTAEPIEVRVAVGASKAALRDHGGYGARVNRFARLRATGHGGQAPVAQSTGELVCDSLPDGITLIDLGDHLPADLNRPERVFQPAGADLPAEFPALRSLNLLPNNLPRQSNSFNCREREIADINKLLREDAPKTGSVSGWPGKSRICFQAATDLARSFPDGMRATELAPVSGAASCRPQARTGGLMAKSRSQIIKAVLIAIICLIFGAGCSNTNQQFKQILNDKSLTAAQRMQKLDNLTGETDPMTEDLPVSEAIIVGAVVLLVIALVVKKKMEAASLATVTAGAGQKWAAKAASKTPKSAKPPKDAKPNLPDGPPYSSVSSFIPPWERDFLANPDWLPDNQDDVDAIPEDEQGVSFFTSRPLPRSALVELTISVGYEDRIVMALPAEAEAYQTGRAPMVRAFTVDGKTVPWYQWQAYDPYRHFYAAKATDWADFRKGVIACFLPVERLDPSLSGYYENDGLEVEEQGDPESFNQIDPQFRADYASVAPTPMSIPPGQPPGHAIAATPPEEPKEQTPESAAHAPAPSGEPAVNATADQVSLKPTPVRRESSTQSDMPDAPAEPAPAVGLSAQATVEPAVEAPPAPAPPTPNPSVGKSVRVGRKRLPLVRGILYVGPSNRDGERVFKLSRNQAAGAPRPDQGVDAAGSDQAHFGERDHPDDEGHIDY